MKKILLFLFAAFTSICSEAQISTSDFVTTWKTDNVGTSLANQITIPATGEYTVYYESIPAGTSGTLPSSGTFMNAQTITFPAAGVYRIAIKPVGATPFHRIAFNSDEADKLLTIQQWGNTAWSSFETAYSGCRNLTALPPVGLPELGAVTSMSLAFNECSSLLSAPNIDSWDVSAVTHMDYMFSDAALFNQPIGSWDVSAVTYMGNMFLRTP